MSINTHSTPPMPGGHHFGRRPLFAALGGTVVLMAIVGAGLWARSDSRESEPAAVVASIQPNLIPAAASANVAGTLANATFLRSKQDVIWIYIVGSEAEAEAIRNAAAGVPGSPSQVVVVGTQAEAVYAANFLRELNPVRVEAGQPQANVLFAGQYAAAR